MSDIFLSYSRDDQATARRFEEAFEREGLSVWWDQTLKPGEAYDRVTEKALQDAKAVVVLWSKKSVESHWVRSEATQAQTNGTLIPVMIEPCKRPIMFELMHTAELGHWKGDPNDSAWRAFFGDVRQFVRKEGSTTSPSAQALSRAPRQFGVRTLLAVVALLVVGASLFWVASRAPKVAPKPVDAAATTPSGVMTEVTLAVLPFRNISSDPAQESFAEGLSEELLNQLTQIRELRVTGRTSSFSFKDKNEDPRVIAEQLGVANLLDGTIRKDDKRLRVTAKLINGKDGTNLWTRSYDHVLTVNGIIAIQEEIAKDVAQALSIRLDVGDMSRIKGGTTNWDAYEKYLHATSAFGRGDFAQAAQDSRDAVALDPNFVGAWFELHGALDRSIGDGGQEIAKTRERLNALAPDFWLTHLTRELHFIWGRKWREAEAAYNAAAAVAPASGAAVLAFHHSILLGPLGRLHEAYDQMLPLTTADPLAYAFQAQLPGLLFALDRNAEGLGQLEHNKKLVGYPGPNAYELLLTLYSRSDADASTIWAQYRPVTEKEPILQSISAQRSHPAAVGAILHKAFNDTTYQDAFPRVGIALFADYFGDKDLALEALSRSAQENDNLLSAVLWASFRTKLRVDPRFKELVRELGLVDYWRTSGNWGDFCKPVGKDEFECH